MKTNHPVVQNEAIHLVLGSGGARGLAHIGVICELEARGYQIKAITGCSMGALIGALYAVGKLDDYADWITQLSKWDVFKFLDISLSAQNGMFKGDKIMDKIHDLIGDVSIEDLEIPFTAVAADIKTGKEIWIEQGDLVDAIRASISVPGIFTPLITDNRVLVDGGILNPLPVPPVSLGEKMMSVAVSLSGRAVKKPFGESVELEKTAKENSVFRGKIDAFMNSLQNWFPLDKKNTTTSDERADLNLTDVMLGMFNTMQDTIARHQLASNPPDVLIEIPTNTCKAHEFHLARKLIPAGKYWTEQALDTQLNMSTLR